MHTGLDLCCQFSLAHLAEILVPHMQQYNSAQSSHTAQHHFINFSLHFSFGYSIWYGRFPVVVVPAKCVIGPEMLQTATHPLIHMVSPATLLPDHWAAITCAIVNTIPQIALANDQQETTKTWGLIAFTPLNMAVFVGFAQTSQRYHNWELSLAFCSDGKCSSSVPPVYTIQPSDPRQGTIR